MAEDFIVSVTFPNSRIEYSYLISCSLYWKIYGEKKGTTFCICNETGYWYKKTPVTIQKVAIVKNDDKNNSSRLRRIIDYEFLTENDPDDWDRNVIVTDTEQLDFLNKLDKRPTKENESMKIFKNVEFGKYDKNDITFSIKGLAFKSINGWVAWNNDTQELTDVSGFTIDSFNDFLYKMPVAIDNIHEGDIVIHNGYPVFCISKVSGGSFTAINPVKNEIIDIIPARNVFGFNYITKIVDFTNGLFNGIAATEENPFGNILPFMLMKDNSEMNELLPLMFMSNNGQLDQNALMMLMCMRDRNADSLIPLMLMSGQNPFNTTFSINIE